MVLFLGVNCDGEKDAEKKPAVVDWEKNNFGIRTSHSHEDVLNNVNIDTDAPQIPKRVKPSRHEPRRKLIKPTITRNKLRIRSWINQQVMRSQASLIIPQRIIIKKK